MKLEKLVKIARDNYLSKKESLLFINFMSERFPNMTDRLYAAEWAIRFRGGSSDGYKKAIRNADGKSMKVIKKYK